MGPIASKTPDPTDHKEVASSITDRRATRQRKEKVAVDSAVNRLDKFEMVEQSLSNFLQTNFPESLRFRLSSVPKNSTTESELYPFLLNIGNDNSKAQNQGEYIRCVVHHVEEMNSYAIKVCGNQNVGRQVHIIVEKDGIDDTLFINNQARKDIQMFLDENPSDEIDVILQIPDDSTTGYAYLGSYLCEQMQGIKINFLQAENTPTHPWIFLCDTFDDDKFLKLRETSKDHGSMFLKVHGCQTIPIEAKIRDIGNDDNKQVIHLLMGTFEIDDSVYVNDCAKDKLRRIVESFGHVADDDVKKEKLERKGLSFQHHRRIYIQCHSNFPKRAFFNFMERYITRIEPIWRTKEDPIEEGSPCILVCFNLSHLQADIADVLKVTPQGCKNMLVVIQNCREGMSPRPMLKNNPSDNVIDFTNILSEDGECYDCHINSLAVEKIQAFIDNN